MAPNLYLLASDNDPRLLPLLRENPGQASQQDEHGYSLVHAAASYNRLDLLRALVQEFHANVNLSDEDDETALFVVETVEAARVLVEELGVDIARTNSEGLTAREKIETEAEFPQVAEYLSRAESTKAGSQAGSSGSPGPPSTTADLPPVPEGLVVAVDAVPDDEANSMEVDPEFKRRIDELAQRGDFESEAAQAELRRLVQDAIADQGLTEERNVRQRQD